MSTPFSTTQAQETFTDLSTQARMPRVNLLPPEIVQGRRLRRTKVALAGSLVVVVGALGGAYALQTSAKNAAQDDLTQAQAEGSRLRAAQAQYADVPKVMAAIDAAETSRETAMTNDVEWYRTMTNFAVTLPSNVWFKTVQMQVNQDATGPVAGALPGVGAITVEGEALDHPDVATWLDVLGRQPGLSDAYFSSSSKEKVDGSDKTVVKFSSSATITDEALSHRFDRKQG
jgi:Tfp pilus assembly protein PilN